ncbi:YdeI/OmpD-associated family protein [Jannaschia marina]|uniref:YdeI/OmpD-associated family protein n=1 Tax=Jannaschia marina TaxID=2741674 RepID=UPI0015CDFA8C|nr:YdeI/OmpD-associated family protein [Jannaschia marina]
MSDWVTFEGRIEPLEWGRTYTILRLPDDVMSALGAAKRVEGEIGDHPVNLAPARAPVIEGAFLWTGKSFLEVSGLEPGELVEVRLRPADPDHVELPDDVAAALRAAGRSADWAARTPGARRADLHRIATAKRAETRAKRIAAVIAAI